MMNSYPEGEHKEINARHILYLVGTDSGKAKMGAITNSEIAAFVTWGLSIATLFAMIPLLDENYHDTTVKKAIGAIIDAMQPITDVDINWDKLKPKWRKYLEEKLYGE